MSPSHPKMSAMSGGRVDEFLLGGRPYFHMIRPPADLGGTVIARWRQLGSVEDELPPLPAHILELNLAGRQSVRPWIDGLALGAHTFRAGDMSFAPAGSQVTFAAKLDVDIVHVELAPELLHGEGAGSFEPRAKLSSARIERAVLRLLAKAQDCGSDVLLREELVGDLSTALVAELGPQRRAAQLRLTPRQQRLAREFVQDTLDSEIALADIACVVGVSPSHLSHCFVTAFGVSPYQFVLDMRVERAKSLIRTSNLSAKEIAWRCGLKNISQLSKLFAARVGLTLTDFRAIVAVSPLVARSTTD
jgi:AraC family transcriptional regulator